MADAATKRAARRALRKLRDIEGVDRLNRRATFMRQLPDDVRHEVARLAAGGSR